MPIIESDSESYALTNVDLNVTATCELDVFLTLRTRVNLAVTAMSDLSVYFEGETEVDMAVFASNTLKLSGEPDTFGETEVDLAVTAICQLSQIQIGNVAVDLAVTATCELYVTEAEQFSIAFIADLGRPETSARSERRAILTVDGEEIPIKEADWIEDEGSTDYRLAVVLADPADGDLITKDAVIGFSFQRKIANVWTTTTVLLEDGQVDETALEHGRKNGANADVFSFTGQTPLQKRFNVTPLTDLIMFDPQKLTLEAEDFDIVRDTNGNEYQVELMPEHRLKMNTVFEEAFKSRMGFSAWHSDLPDEFIELSRVDFKAGRSMIEEIRSLVGFWSADFQLVGNEIWIKDGTVEHPSSLPVRQVTIREGKLKQLNKTEEFERYDGVDLTYNERQLEYDFVTTRVDSSSSSVDVFGKTTTTTNSKTVYELRRNSQPDRIISERVWLQDQTVTIDGVTIEERHEHSNYDLYGNEVSRQVIVNARVPSIINGIYNLEEVRREDHDWIYRGHPFEKDKIFMWRYTVRVNGLLLVDTQNPMLGRPAIQEYLTAYRSLNLAEGQTTYRDAIEHSFEEYTPRRDKMVSVRRQRVHYPSQTVENETEEVKAGDIGISTLIGVENRTWVMPRGTDRRDTPDKLLDLDAGEVPLRFAVPASRRHLSMLQNLPGRVSATAIDFDESIIKGTTVNFRGRGGVDLGICRIMGRRLSIRPRAWTASYTARQVGVSNEYILVDNEDPHMPAEIAMDSNEQHTITVRFECFAGYSIRCTTVAGLTVEMRAVGDVSWIDIESTPIDMTPYALTIQEFQVRLTTGTIAAPVRVQFNIYASPS